MLCVLSAAVRNRQMMACGLLSGGNVQRRRTYFFNNDLCPVASSCCFIMQLALFGVFLEAPAPGARWLDETFHFHFKKMKVSGPLGCREKFEDMIPCGRVAGPLKEIGLSSPGPGQAPCWANEEGRAASGKLSEA